MTLLDLVQLPLLALLLLLLRLVGLALLGRLGLLGLVLLGGQRAQALGHGGHHVHVLAGSGAGVVEVQALLDLVAQLLSVGLRGLVDERVDSGGDGALVGEVPRDSALVLGRGAADERRVVDETVLGGVALGLQGAEQGLLGTQDLHGGGGALGQGSEGAGLLDQAGRDGLADQGAEVGRDGGHLLLEVRVQLLAVQGQRDHAVGEDDDVEHVLLGGVHAHGGLGGLHHALGGLLVSQDLHQAGDLLFGQLRLVLQYGKQFEDKMKTVITNNVCNAYAAKVSESRSTGHSEMHLLHTPQCSTITERFFFSFF